MTQDRITEEIKKTRAINYPIHPVIANRWSPRAMTGEAITELEIKTLFEAARWAPSCFNSQPWRFLYAKRETADWEIFFQLLVPFNQSWVEKAALLSVVISKDTFDHNGNPAPTHSYDTGSAWMNVALQGTAMGLVVHGMQGFDYEKARKDLLIPEGFTVEAMFAVGRRASKESLSEELRKKEVISQRKPLQEIMIPGRFH